MPKKAKRGVPTIRRVVIGLAFLSAIACATAPRNAKAQTPSPAIGASDIGGVVSGPHGPEAGVWVIAESVELPTRFAKIVVTDDLGRYVIPDLPAVNYTIFVRGYGLVDSPRFRVKPGEHIDLPAIPAPDAAAAAHYYPAIYWYSMLKMPPESELGGSRIDWLKQMKNIGCIGCHQIGQEATRTIPAQFGQFASGEEAWARRLQSGLAGTEMTREAGSFGGAPLKYLGDWTDRIAQGALPKRQPPRPQGLERNLVITTWDWGTPHTYMHDLISSDERNPTVNAYGRLFGSPEYSSDDMAILDPKTNTTTFFKMPVRDQTMPEVPGFGFTLASLQPSAYWGDEKIWSTRANNHNAMIDDQGRVWLAAAIRGVENPAYCRKGSNLPQRRHFRSTNRLVKRRFLTLKRWPTRLLTHAFQPIIRASATTGTIHSGSAVPDRSRDG